MLHLIRTLRPYLKPYWKMAVWAILFSLPLAAIKGFQTYLVKDVFDKGLSANSQFSDTVRLAAILLGLGILNYPFRFFHFYWIRYVVDKATCDMRTDLYRKMQKLPLSFYNKNKQGVLLSYAMNDTQVLAQGFRSMIDLIREPLTALILFGQAIYLDWKLTMIILLTAPLFAIIFDRSGKKIRKNISQVQESVADMTHNISEGLSGQKIVKAFNLQSYLVHRFSQSQDHFFNAQMETTFTEENAHPLVELVGAFAFSGVLLFAHHRISSGALTTGGFISFVTALALMMDPIRKFSQANVKLNQSLAALDRLQDIFTMEEEVDQGAIAKATFDHEIEIKNVTFSYGDHSVLKNFNLTISKGTKVALVGLSGSGKSTLVNLLLRLYPVTEGEILIDGRNINEYSLESLRALFGLVSQDIFLFHDTVNENLLTGISRNEEELTQALDVAYASGFVSELPKKRETVIGDRGTRLSGGQSQRLTIARAFLRKSPILLFDEATSALDNESEKVVQAALERLEKNHTVLAVAHRLSTIQNYDKIVVLKEGRKIEEGDHQALMNLSGEYQKLYILSQRN
ncbi:MAG: ABC transporter ATP-binding protein [Bacteriovoracaceae bacterium]